MTNIQTEEYKNGVWSRPIPGNVVCSEITNDGSYRFEGEGLPNGVVILSGWHRPIGIKVGDKGHMVFESDRKTFGKYTFIPGSSEGMDHTSNNLDLFSE